MHALFVIIVAILIMAAIYGMLGLIAYAAVGGLNELTDEIREFLKWKRTKNQKLPSPL